jgi:hypothetical protein
VRGGLLWCWPALLGLVTSACASESGSSEASLATSSASVTPTEDLGSTTSKPTTSTAATPAPTSTSPATTTTTASPEPATTAAPTLLDFEVVEWAEYPYANLADPANRDTRVEILVRNPNDVPVEIENDSLEVGFVNGAGQVVYTNPNPTLFIWEGAWVKGGETFPISACVCFDSSGLTRETWETIELVAPVQAAEGVVYTDDVKLSLGEWFRLSDRHLGGDSLGVDFEIVNTSDQVLSSFDVRVTARDADGHYVGVAVWGSFVDRSSPTIAPGASASGVLPTLIDYFDEPLTYTSEAIGIVQG